MKRVLISLVFASVLGTFTHAYLAGPSAFEDMDLDKWSHLILVCSPAFFIIYWHLCKDDK